MKRKFFIIPLFSFYLLVLAKSEACENKLNSAEDQVTKSKQEFREKIKHVKEYGKESDEREIRIEPKDWIKRRSKSNPNLHSEGGHEAISEKK